MPTRPPYTEEERRNALALVGEHGRAEASRRTGVTTRTLNRWARDAGITSRDAILKTRAATEAARAASDRRYEQTRQELRDEFAEAARYLAQRAKAADDRHKSGVMTAAAIAIDKAELLSGRATSRQEHVRPERVEAAVSELEAMLTGVE